MEDKHIEIIDASEKIHEMIYKVIVQINDPRKMDKRVLESFVGEDSSQKVTLVKGGQSCKGDLLNADPHSMGINLPDEDFEILRNDRILVQFKHPTYDKYFVIQTMVKKVYSSWVNVECQDPRYDQRYDFKLQSEIEFIELPQEFYNLIKKRKVHIVREILYQKTSKGKPVHKYTEGIYSGLNLKNADLKELNLGEKYLHPDFRRVLTTTPLKGELRNISQGGICILLDDKIYEKRNLLLVRLTTPSLEGINTALNCDSLSLNILGVIRSFSTIGRKHGLHIQYLKRLEVEQLDNTLSILEKNYKLTGKPL
jgi:hypothetical protein